MPMTLSGRAVVTLYWEGKKVLEFAGQNGFGLAELVELSEDLQLELKLFNDRLDDQIDVGHALAMSASIWKRALVAAACSALSLPFSTRPSRYFRSRP